MNLSRLAMFNQYLTVCFFSDDPLCTCYIYQESANCLLGSLVPSTGLSPSRIGYRGIDFRSRQINKTGWCVEGLTDIVPLTAHIFSTQCHNNNCMDLPPRTQREQWQKTWRFSRVGAQSYCSVACHGAPENDKVSPPVNILEFTRKVAFAQAT